MFFAYVFWNYFGKLVKLKIYTILNIYFIFFTFLQNKQTDLNMKSKIPQLLKSNISTKVCESVHIFNFSVSFYKGMEQKLKYVNNTSSYISKF